MLLGVDSPRARIVVLGGPSIDRGEGAGRAAGLPGGRAELVFAYLSIEHRREVSRDELANALWPELLPDSWAAALRSVVSEVRRFFDDAGLPGNDMISSAHGGYQLRLPPGVTVDADDARDQLSEARAQFNKGDARRAADAAAQAAATLDRPFLPRHDADWVTTIRQDLEASRNEALELAARAHAKSGDARAAKAAAERLVRVEPYSEVSHRLLIEVLGQAGDRVGARRAYEHCRTLLREELGLEPSEETEAVRRRALAAAAPAPSSEAQAAPSGPGQGRSARPAEASAFTDLTVLVVEDHAFQRRAALALLARLGVGTLLEAPDGAAALDLLAEVSPPDVIICDLDMPAMDGVEFIRHVAQRGLASAVAIASALDRSLLDTVRAVGEGYGLQILGAVEKPLTAMMLSELLSAYRPPRSIAETETERQLSASEIVAALADGGVVAHLDPIADLATGRIAAAEIVPRWRDPDSGTVTAASFAAARATPETTERLGERLVELAGAAARDLEATAGFGIGLVVRLPHARLDEASLADRLAAAADLGGGTPADIGLLVAPSALPGSAAVALDVLARVRIKGFGLWLDDAGPEARVDRLPLTGVRLPSQLTADAAANPVNVEALAVAIDRARVRGLKTIGSGCESASEFVLLLEAGASHAQGAFIGAATSLHDLAESAVRWTPPVLIPDDAP
jgi:DNA-binding SARP family transcriptional activator/EAL domain-containing protein (putative c-di-GMP-specific phosphodiesterase class I)/AmiR/NasT family two-component response regulator